MSSPRLSRLLNDGAALRRNGLPFIPLSQRARLSAAEVSTLVHFRPAAQASRSVSAPSSAGSAVLRSASRPSGTQPSRSVSSFSSVARHEALASAGSFVRRSALRPSGTENPRSTSASAPASASSSSSSGRPSSSVSFVSRRSERSVCSASASASVSVRSAVSSAVSSSVSSSSSRGSGSRTVRPSLREIAAARYPRGSASSDRSTSTVTTPVPRSPATSVGSSTVIHHAPRSAPRSASRSSESVAAADSRAPCTSTRSRPSESAGYDRALADAATARLNAKFPGCFRLTSGSRPSAPALKSAMKQPGSRKVEKRVQFIGEHVKIVDRWIVPGVHIWSDPYSGPKVTPLATPDMDGEVEDWRARLTQVRARFDARRAQFHERRDRLRSESAERSARYI